MFEDDDSFKAYWIKAPLFFSFFKMRKNRVWVGKKRTVEREVTMENMVWGEWGEKGM